MKSKGDGQKRAHEHEDDEQGGGPPRNWLRMLKTKTKSDSCTCTCGKYGTIVASLQTRELPNN